MAVRNRIITRGFGGKTLASTSNPGFAGPITQGYSGTFFERVIEQGRRAVRHGRAAAKHVADKIIVYARLIKINDDVDVPKIAGSTSVPSNIFKDVKVKIFEGIAKVKRVLVSIRRLK